MKFKKRRLALPIRRASVFQDKRKKRERTRNDQQRKACQDT